MGSVEAQIKEKLEAEFSPLHLEIENESYKHKGHAGDNESGESHFRITLVSEQFEGENRVNRQRMVYDLLKKELSETVHALSLKLLSSAEYKG